MREAKAVWKVGEVWVGHREKTEGDKGVGGGGKRVLWCLRAALCYGRVVPRKPNNAESA